MSETTTISWCDRTWSPWEGCTKVSPGCDNCYASARNGRFSAGANWGPGAPRRKTAESSWRRVLRWDFEAERNGKPISVFPSLCDPFDNEVDPAWRVEFFALIRETPHLNWLLLTKRVGNAHQMIGEALIRLGQSLGLDSTDLLPGWPWPNVWLGATVVNQEEADRDVPKLLAVPARVRFLSIEPMLGPVDLSRWLRCHSRGGGANGKTLRCGLPAGHEGDHSALIETSAPWFANGGELHWVIAGGESGPKARPAHPDWFRSLRDQCAATGVAFHFKQWGEWARGADLPDHIAGSTYCDFDGDLKHDNERVWHVGKKAAGRMLDGATHDGFPA